MVIVDFPFGPQLSPYKILELINKSNCLFCISCCSLLPSWYKSALFNELYFVADGGTVWLDVDRVTDNKTPIPEFVKEHGRFAYLEGINYIT